MIMGYSKMYFKEGNGLLFNEGDFYWLDMIWYGCVWWVMLGDVWYIIFILVWFVIYFSNIFIIIFVNGRW